MLEVGEAAYVIRMNTCMGHVFFAGVTFTYKVIL
jgi:hypothetical protein